jgi:hypothetical protein
MDVKTFLFGFLIGVLLSHLHERIQRESFAVVDALICSADNRNPSCEAHFRRQGLERGPDGQWRVPPIGGGGIIDNNGVGWNLTPMF